MQDLQNNYFKPSKYCDNTLLFQSRRKENKLQIAKLNKTVAIFLLIKCEHSRTITIYQLIRYHGMTVTPEMRH